MDRLTNLSAMNIYYNVSYTENTSSLLPGGHEEEVSIWQRTLRELLWLWVPPFLLIFGVSGNIVSLIVYSRHSMCLSVSSVFFRALVLVDTVLVLSAPTRHWVITMYGAEYDVRRTAAWICKIHTLIVYWSQDMSGWLLSTVAVERTMGVMWPHRHKDWFTKRVACKLIVAESIIALMSNICVTLGYNLVPDGHCSLNPTFGHVWTYINMFKYSILPFSVIIVSNIMTIYHARGAMVRRQHMDSSCRRHTISELSTILITVSIFYLILTFPLMIFFIVKWTWKGILTESVNAKFDLAFTVCFLLAITNSSVNFILYFISGLRFRTELKRMLCKYDSAKSSSFTKSYSFTKYERNSTGSKC